MSSCRDRLIIMYRSLTGVVGLSLGLLAGCPQLASYACGDDESCNRQGQLGWCAPDGACVYPSDACDSGWIRSPNAAERPGECDPGPGAGTTDGTGTTNAGTTTSSTTQAHVDSSESTTTTSGSDGSTGSSSDSGELPGCGWLLALEVSTTYLSASEVLEGFPLAVVIDDSDVVAAIVAAGTDPVITDADGVVLAQELESIDEAAGTLVVWVRLPAYALGEAVPLQLRWGVRRAPGDPGDVWTDHYAGVWHMGDSLSGVDGDEILNSMNLLEPGLTAGQMAPEQSVAGVMGRGIAFDAVDDVIRVDAQFVGQLESYSLSLWARFEGADGEDVAYFQRLNGTSLMPRCWRMAGGEVFCQYKLVESAATHGLVTDTNHGVGQLMHLAMIRDAAANVTQLYLDGELVDTNVDPPDATLDAGANPFEIGHGHVGSWHGMIDEVRVSEAPLSAAWIRADYRSQLEPSLAVQSVGAVEPVPCG